MDRPALSNGATIGRRGLLVVIGLIAIALAGSSASSRRSIPSLPTWCDTGRCVGVPADPPRSGVLGDTGGCIWLDIDGQRVEPLWPFGYAATLDPLIVYDAGGREVARGGPTLTTPMLGPDSHLLPNGCGLSSSIRLYFGSVPGS